MKRVLCVWLPNWALQRILAGQAERDEEVGFAEGFVASRQSRPVILYRAERGGMQVVTCCAAAARRGVFAGMPLAEARGLFSGEEPDFQPHDRGADWKALEKLAVWCHRFSPRVGLQEAERPDTLLLDVTGCAALFHNEERLAEEVVAGFHQRGFQVRVAIADTIGAAWACSHYGSHSNPASQISILASDQGFEPLRQLPVEALRLDFQTIRILHELDLRRIGQLEGLPRGSLPSRLGSQLTLRLDQATGRVPELIDPVQPREAIVASEAFEPPLTQPAALECVLRQLAARILEQLAERGEGLLRLRIELTGSGGSVVTRSAGFIRPCTTAAHLVPMILARLERVVVSREIREVQLRVTSSTPLEARQVSFLSTPRDERVQQQFARLLERLSSRLGERSVQRPQLHPDVQPEYAYRWKKAVGWLESGSSGGRGSEVGQQRDLALNSIFVRPLHLKSRPVPLTEEIVLAAEPPIRFRWGGQCYVVLRSWGPERIATGWWRNRPIHRDYYRVETERGHRFWLFRHQHDREWFLQGEFV